MAELNKVDLLNYWNYFLLIDDDLVSTCRYVHHCEDNFQVYSSEFARIILTACAEIDTACRLLCNAIDINNSYHDMADRSGNISEYQEIILGKYPKISRTEVFLVQLENSIKPWFSWGTEEKGQPSTPEWWKEYQLIKHYRHSNFHKANLRNAYSAVSALFVILMYLNKTTSGYTHNCFREPVSIFSMALSDINESVIGLLGEAKLPDFQ